MDVRTKVLYHQLHPAKLLTDWLTAGLTCALFWRHYLVAGLVLGVVPSLLVTWALLHWADLESYPVSRLGRYIERHMTRGMEALRLVGITAVWVSSWNHWLSGMVLGVVVIIGAWCRGLMWPRSA